MGALFLGLSPVLGPELLPVGGLLCLLPSVLIYLNAKRSGALIFMNPQKRGEVLVFYITATRKIFPILGRELLERYIKLVPGYGRIRVTRNSDYMFLGKKAVIARQGVAHTIPIEQAQITTKLKDAGFRNYQEVREFLEWKRRGGFEAGTVEA